MNQINKYIALLRGINLGGRQILKDDLKEVFEHLGFSNVKTVIQSGNVIFESDSTNLAKLTSIIESGLSEKFNYKAKAIVLDKDQLKQDVDLYPFRDRRSDDFHDYIAFLSQDIAQEIVGIVQADLDNEQFEAGKNLIYWRVRKGMSLDSNLAKVLAMSKYKDFNTVRNINTLEKILQIN